MADQFTWIPFYRELAEKLLAYEDRQGELIGFLKGLQEKSVLEKKFSILPLEDVDADGKKFLYQEIDPFTFIGVFNRGVRTPAKKRIAITNEIKSFLKIQVDAPTDFSSIPVLNNFNSWFFPYASERKQGDVKALWDLAAAIVRNQSEGFAEKFERCLKIKQVRITKLTQGMYWIAPDRFLATDDPNCEFLKTQYGIDKPKETWAGYEEFLRQVRQKTSKNFTDISMAAWDAPESDEGQPAVSSQSREPIMTAELPSNTVSLAENKIFYGPPGTGKTYHTVAAALEILDPEFLKNNRDNRPQLNTRFKQLRELGHIEFTTFHQSFSYEDFVEGLKAFSSEDSGSIQYEVVDGVFKDFCLKARPQEAGPSRAGGAKTAGNLTGRRIWKMSLGNTLGADAGIFEECFKQSMILLGYGGRLDFGSCNSPNAIREKLRADSDYEAKAQDYTVTSVNTFRNQMKVGDLVVVSEGNHKVRAIAEITGDYRFLGNQREDHYVQSRTVNWLQHFTPSLPASSILNCSFSQMTLYELKDSVLKREQLLERIQMSAGNAGKPMPAAIPYVFIIDEINRGNISKIFGELITLIEPDKRAGASEAASVRLPYSKDLFSIPANVHIIGTMNTADRSLAQLDIALRRRFTFQEMMPKSELLTGVKVGDIDIQKVFEAINDRIELLYDREHTIGHSFFLPLKEEGKATIETLAQIMESKILPLLEEYFYEDWGKIHLVLGGQKKEELAFICPKFASARIMELLGDAGTQAKAYKRNVAALKNPEAYKSVYLETK